MRRHLGTLLITTGLVLIFWPVVTWAYGLYWQQKLARAWPRAARPRRATGAGSRAGETASPAEPAPIARLDVPRIHLQAMVVDGTDPVSLRRGPAHLPDTCRPGESGNCVIAAHRDGWFRDLQKLQQGDPVDIATEDCAYEYVVEEKRAVEPDRADLLRTGEYPRLTLVTCTGPGYPHSTQRLLVFCHLSQVQPLALLTGE